MPEYGNVHLFRLVEIYIQPRCEVAIGKNDSNEGGRIRGPAFKV